MSSTSIHELESLDQTYSPAERQLTNEHPSNQTDALPPTDRGKGAYMALACCTVAQAPIWGKT